MAYSELIKNFAHIRDYMREFYVYGFKSRNDYAKKDQRSYDNERRRIDSWLGKYMHFHQTPKGKCSFLSVDSRTIARNPLYQAFETKSFTERDIALHFFILDILADGKRLTVTEVLETIMQEYLDDYPDFSEPDEKTVRNKLKEYVELGLLKQGKSGVKTVYYIERDNINIDSWEESIAFFSEQNPLGVIGSYIENDQTDDNPFRFKHNYILTALDSEIVYEIADAIRGEQWIEVEAWNKKGKKTTKQEVLPFKIYISTQTGRRYVLAFDKTLEAFGFCRLDLIRTINRKKKESGYDEYSAQCDEFRKQVWGVSVKGTTELEHLEMVLRFPADMRYMASRLKREKRNGTVTKIGEELWKYEVDTYDAMELMPWIRTFTGKIQSITCTNPKVTETYYSDLQAIASLYGGGKNAV